MAACHCLGLNKTVASFKWNYPVSLSKDRHIFRSREHETRVPWALSLSLSMRCNETTCPSAPRFAINPDSTPSGRGVQELIRRASTILSCDRAFRETSRWGFPSDSLPSFRNDLGSRDFLCRFFNGSVSWIIDQAPRSAPTNGWQKRVERISKEGYDYFSTPFFPGIHFLLLLFRWFVTFFSSLDDSSPFIYMYIYINNSFRELPSSRTSFIGRISSYLKRKRKNR